MVDGEKSFVEKLAEIANYYGLPNQLDKTIEELGELLTSIVKYKHNKCVETTHHIIEECADVSIMITQLLMFLDDTGLFDKFSDEKVDRQLKRIDEEQKAKQEHLEKVREKANGKK